MTEFHSGEFERLATGDYLEGLAVDHGRNVVWYSDPIKGGVHGVTFEGVKVLSFNEDRRWTGGLLVNDDGAVLSSGEGGIMWNTPHTGKSGWLLSEMDGRPINGVNEMVPDGTGGFFFGTSDLERVRVGQTTRPTAIYRLTADREVRRVSGDIGFTNGLMFDHERRRLYCSDTFHCTWAFDVSEDLSLTNQRVVLEKLDSDGMALDAEGNLWVTGYRSRYIERVSPEGHALPSISIPMGAVSQIRFGGPDMRDFYLTVVPTEAGDTLKEGGRLPGGKSFLYRGRSQVPGMPLAAISYRLD